MARNATPDILGEIMGISKQENSTAVKQANTTTSKPEKNKAIKHPNNLAVEQENSTAVKQANTTTSKPEKNKAIKHPNNLAVEQENSTAVEQANATTSKLEKNITFNKEKATFNMSTQIMEHLDEVWFKMKKMLKSKNQRITKTLIVETSLKMSLEDFSNHLEDSEVFKEITKDPS